MKQARWFGARLGLCVLLASACAQEEEPMPDGKAGSGADKDAASADEGGRPLPVGDAGPRDSGKEEVDAGKTEVDAGRPGGGLGTDIGDPNDVAEWTVFVYGHGDHNLSNTLLRDIGEMARAQVSEDVRVVVLADFDASQEIATTGDKFPEGVAWLRIPGNEADPQELGVEKELNLDDPDVLMNTVAAAFSQFPSKHRALILWDHGGAWLGGFGSDTQNGTVSAPTPMSTQDVAGAVQRGLEMAGVEAQPALDLFSFDTCLMSGAEVAWEFRELAAAYIANAEIDYGDGWDYDGFLSYLSSHLDATPRELAQEEVRLWDAHHESASFNDTLLRSHAAIDGARLPELAESIAAFVQTLSASGNLSGVELARAGYFSLPPYMNELSNPQASPELRDLGQFLLNMSEVSDSAVASAAADARQSLQDVFISSSAGTLRMAAGQYGMHVELPLAAAMSQDLFSEYAERASGWSEASHWSDALKSYSELDDGMPPEITAAIFNADNPDAEHLPMVEFSVPSTDVAEVEVDLATPGSSNDELIFFGIVGKSPIDPVDSYQFAWDGQLMTLPDGAGEQQAIYVTIWEDVGDGETAVLATFGLAETASGEQALGALLFQDGDSETGLLTLLDPPVTMTLEEVARDLPGATFTPILLSLSLSTGEQNAITGSPIPLDSATLPLGRGPAVAGSYALVTTVGDVFGNYNSDIQVTNIVTPFAPPSEP